MGATPSPPPTRTTVPSSLRMWLGRPRGAMKSRMGLPSRKGHIFNRGFAHSLDDYGDRAVGPIEIGHGQRDAFPMLVDASHHKVSGTCCSRHIRRFHVPEEGRRTKLYSTADEKHHTPWKAYGSKIQGKGSFDAFTICPADPRSLA